MKLKNIIFTLFFFLKLPLQTPNEGHRNYMLLEPACYQPMSSPAAGTTAPSQHNLPQGNLGGAKQCTCQGQHVCHQFPANNVAYQQEPKEELSSAQVQQQTAYQRTLEYVEQCHSWTSSMVIEPSCNMVINDMSSSMNSFVEENRYFELIQ